MTIYKFNIDKALYDFNSKQYAREAEPIKNINQLAHLIDAKYEGFNFQLLKRSLYRLRDKEFKEPLAKQPEMIKNIITKVAEELEICEEELFIFSDTQKVL